MHQIGRQEKQEGNGRWTVNVQKDGQGSLFMTCPQKSKILVRNLGGHVVFTEESEQRFLKPGLVNSA